MNYFKDNSARNLRILFMLLLTISISTAGLCLGQTTGISKKAVKAEMPKKAETKQFNEFAMGDEREPAINESRIMIDDFEDGNLRDRLDGACGAWNMDPNEEFTSCNAEVVDMLAPDLSTKVLKLTYDIDAPTRAQNGFWMKLQNLDATAYDHLEFYVRGDRDAGFTTTFRIEFKKFKDDQRVEKIAASYIVTGVTGMWQRVSVPLNVFNAIETWNDLDEFVVILDSRLCDAKQGVLYLDNIRLTKTNYPGPSAYDFLGSSIKKSYSEHTQEEWAKFLAKRLKGYPKTVLVDKEFPEDDREFLMTIARDTWKFFDNIVDKNSHLPLDTIALTEKKVFDEDSRVGDYTNVTNIGIYLMAIITAYDFKFITKEDAIGRINETLNTVERLETYKNFLYNYYDTTTMERTSNFLSFVDSGWLAAGIYTVKNSFPEELTARCEDLLSEWNFRFYYDEVSQQFYHGYFTNIKAYSNYHYGSFYTEPRIFSYLAIAREDVPMEHWFNLDRTLPEDYTWQQQTPLNRKEKEYKNIKYYGGLYQYNNMLYIPSWGGSLFEALMPTILLNEIDLSPNSLGLNDYRHAMIHKTYAMEKLGLPVWGMSPCSIPSGGYGEYGIPPLGLKGYEPGVVTPHVSFLALEFIPDDAIANIRELIKRYKIYGEYGLYDSVDPKTGKVAYKYLCLDQGMIFLALNNYLNNGIIRKRFHSDPVVQRGEFLLTEENIFE